VGGVVVIEGRGAKELFELTLWGALALIFSWFPPFSLKTFVIARYSKLFISLHQY
jgi:hypothetical protein